VRPRRKGWFGRWHVYIDAITTEDGDGNVRHDQAYWYATFPTEFLARDFMGNLKKYDDLFKSHSDLLARHRASQAAAEAMVYALLVNEATKPADVTRFMKALGLEVTSAG
jgi:hypothetical protein